MKKILVLIMACALMLALCACGSDPLYANQNATEDATAETEAAVDISEYEQSFDGLQKYLIDLKLLPEDEKSRNETFAEVLGAEKGIRYSVSSSAFIELYEYKDKTSDEARFVLDQVEKEGKFVIAGLDPLTAVMSDSGKYMLAYNDKLGYNGYEAIINAFKAW